MKNWRIVLLGIVVLLSVSLITTKGLTYGIDFTGGTELKLEVANGDDTTVDAIVTILKERLNGMGLKSTQVLKEADGKHITVKVSSTNPDEVDRIEEIINQQATFEQFVEGDLCAQGDEIQLDYTRQGGAYTSGKEWMVFVRTVGDAPKRCGKAMEGKVNHMTDVFLDRPRHAFILANSTACNELAFTEFKNNQEDSGYTMLSFLEDRANIPVVCYNETLTNEEHLENNAADSVNESILSELGISVATTDDEESEQNLTFVSLDDAVSKIGSLIIGGSEKAVIMVPKERLPKELLDAISIHNLSVIVAVKGADQPFHINAGSAGGREDNSDSWIDNLTGLKSTLSIQEGLTDGSPIYGSTFTGGADTKEEANKIVMDFKIWLTSGNLPSEVSVIMEKPNLPQLGHQFLYYAALMAIIAVALVAVIVSFRYREPKISVGILLTSFSEIISILGFASLASWELDLAAMAGIIAAIGTGVDDQIVITDETLRGERKTKETQFWDVRQSINRAFFIIMASAVTTICAMLPLMSIIDLRGFAFTSIIGILIGVLITRPAYGRLVELIT